MCRLALALDVGSLEEAAKFRPLYSRMGAIKVGLELITSAEGHFVIDDIVNEGGRVGFDLKAYDIPTTMAKAAVAAVRRGFSFMTIHALAGEEAIKQVCETVAKANEDTGNNMLVVVVTRLTSDTKATDEVMLERAMMAVSVGAKAVVCGSPDLQLLQEAHETVGLLTLVPGTRSLGVAANDQVRVTTQEEAIGAGADLLVLGREVTDSNDPEAIVEGIASRIAPLITA
jgi:orotidine-5'-phosphate decarboxylase